MYTSPKSDREYDQYEVGKYYVENALSLDVKQVNELALKAMIKRLERNEGVPISTAIDGRSSAV